LAQSIACNKLRQDTIQDRAWNPDVRPIPYCDCRKAVMSRRVYVSVSGGVVDEVIVPTETDGTWTVIDWDNIESDPEREWQQFDEEERAYIKMNLTRLRTMRTRLWQITTASRANMAGTLQLNPTLQKLAIFHSSHPHRWIRLRPKNLHSLQPTSLSIREDDWQATSI
jgi:hypothetical protein